MSKHYLVYQITNLVNNKIYIGIHTTEEVDDGYFGSSVVLKNAIKKYGVDNFKREILFDFDNPEDMLAKERELVDDEFVSRTDTYNMNIGGGSFYYINRNGMSGHTKATQIRLKKYREDSAYRSEYCLKISHGMLKNKGIGFLGKVHKVDTKAKIGAANSTYQKGAGNSQYGTCWINKEGQVLKIKKENLESYLEQGWIRGRR